MEGIENPHPFSWQIADETEKGFYLKKFKETEQKVYKFLHYK